MQKLNPNTEISRSEAYLDTQLDDESIVMQIESGNIYGMGETAKTIWDIIAQPISFSRHRRKFDGGIQSGARKM